MVDIKYKIRSNYDNSKKFFIIGNFVVIKNVTIDRYHTREINDIHSAFAKFKKVMRKKGLILGYHYTCNSILNVK